jgi:ferredoxin
MGYVPVIDENACAGHAVCDAIAPEIFEVEEVARVIGSGPDELILEAAQGCPSVAIRVLDDSGRQVFP